MRPLELRISGMRSYRQETTIDFSDLRLVTITGATGAGKSTILEGIIFALYGTATWAGGTTTPLISDGMNRMNVSLRFEADGRQWRVTRSVVRTGTGGHELRCLSDDTVPVVDNARAVNARIQDLIGLDVEGFKSCVLLPQGRFDRLLKATAKDRIEALKGILGLKHLDDVRDKATDVSKAANERLLELTRHRSLFLPDPAGMVAGAEATLADHEPRLDALVGVQEKVEKLSADATTLRETATAADQRKATLEAVHDAEQLARLAELAEIEPALALALSTAQQELAAAERGAKAVARWRAERAAAKMDAPSLAALLSSLAGLRRECDTINEDEQRLAGERPDPAPARAALAEATDAAERAQGALQAAQALHAAHTASEHLHGGEACPVCARDLPADWTAPAAPDDLDKLTTACKAAEKARQAAADAATRADAAATQHEREQERIAERRARLAEQIAKLPDWLDTADIDEAAATVKAEQGRLAALTSKAEQRTAGVSAAQQAVAAAEREHYGQVGAPADREKGQAKRLFAILHPEAECPASDSMTLVELREWAGTVNTEADAAVAALTQEAASAREQIDAALTEGRELLSAEGFKTLAELQEAHRDVYATVVNARQQRDTAQEQVEPVKELDSLIADVEAVAAEHAEVAHQLGVRQFTGALIEHRQRTLLAIASGILGDMTNGEFGFTESFAMIARRSGVERGPETLSGGETFLASLALALALVELAGRTGGKLNALFIDEGFGSLDPDALAQAMTELARRARTGRLIALISHVPVMAEQLDQTIQVVKTPSGSELTINAAVPLVAT